MTFVGQSSVRTKGLSQKEQTRIVREFREGRHNCLVSTCIGEEGLGTSIDAVCKCMLLHLSYLLDRYRRSRFDCLLRLAVESYSACAAHGPHGQKAPGTMRYGIIIVILRMCNSNFLVYQLYYFRVPRREATRAAARRKILLTRLCSTSAPPSNSTRATTEWFLTTSSMFVC